MSDFTKGFDNLSGFDDFDDLEDEDFSEDGVFSVEGRTLLIDGDIVLYKPCCIFNEDTDEARNQIGRLILSKINQLMASSEADSYRFFVTTKKNYRDYIADDYKANRKDIVRPVNLSWAKKYCVDMFGAESIGYLEADDLLAIFQDDTTVIWSTDKDLRQVGGMHIDDESQEIVHVTDFGELTPIGFNASGGPNKFYFTGYIGLMYQCLIGDNTDNILGCAIRENRVYKSGKRIGQHHMKRVGSSPLKAYNLLIRCTTEQEALEIVKTEYKYKFPHNWEYELEKQARLLYMTRIFDEDSRTIKLWTHDERDLYLNLRTGGKYE